MEEITLGSLARAYANLEGSRGELAAHKKELKDEMEADPRYAERNADLKNARELMNNLREEVAEASGLDEKIEEAADLVVTHQTVVDGMVERLLAAGALTGGETVELNGVRVMPIVKVTLKSNQTQLPL